jgi:hypothetical protein
MLAQFLFTDVPDVISPFFMTYVGVALFALLLPLKNMTDRHYTKSMMSLLDDMSNNHSPSARPKRVNAGKTTSHQSWADVVRPKPSKGSIGGLSPITKR